MSITKNFAKLFFFVLPSDRYSWTFRAIIIQPHWKVSAVRSFCIIIAMLENMKQNSVNTHVTFLAVHFQNLFKQTPFLQVYNTMYQAEAGNIWNYRELLLNTNAKMNKEKNNGHVAGKSCKAFQFLN